MNRKPKFLRRLTLTECIAIAMLGVLFFVLATPVAGSGPGKRHQCLSNMQQVGIATLMYVGDNNDQYPTDDPAKKAITGRPPYPKNKPEHDPLTTGWVGAIRPYVKNTAFWRCNEDRSKAPRIFENPDLATEYPVSYAINGWTEYQLKQTDIAQPENWILLGERNNSVIPATGSYSFYFWSWQGLPIVWPPAANPDPTQLAAQDLILDRHNGRSAWIYGDGHVRAVKLSELWKPGKENAFWPTKD